MPKVTATHRLLALVDKLAAQARQLDQKNSHGKNQFQFKEKVIFSDQLFSTKSSQYIHYVLEVSAEINRLDELIRLNKNEVADMLIIQIEQQIASLVTAFQANSTRRKSIKYAKKKSTFNSLNQATPIKITPTKELYSKLAEHHEYERRLAAMIAERESLLSQSNITSSEQLNSEILALHQRLGRCRQAIIGIEREIELANKHVANN